MADVRAKVFFKLCSGRLTQPKIHRQAHREQEAGEEVVLARGKIPVAKLAPFQPPASKCQFGKLRGVVSTGEALFDPLPEEELTARA